ncbi:serine/threonine-protein kinase [Actinoplanes sp. NPDC051494]|uniref:serine/threonine-protein kinase n=1 Tax=Actinoplanes sp. NPDC051494 TaxID=3363907 RepID=UPI0037B0AFB5
MVHTQLVGERYLLREPLGRGGMSVVWRAEDTLLGREVAVKVLSADVSADPAALGRMYAEARAAASLRHDNVVEVYDYGETQIDGVAMPYVVMELVNGRALSDMLRAGALSWELAVLIGAQVAAALAAAHDRGVVHRDVKPANIMIHSGGVKLVDFGISAAVGELEHVSDQILGTPAYLAPERLAGGMVRPATDVYALGLLLYLMLAGRMPWHVSTTTQMLKAHRYRLPGPLPPIAGLPDGTADLVRRCLAKAPSDRPAAVTAARLLRQAAGLAPLMMFAGLDDRDPAAADTPTEAATVAPTSSTVTRTVTSRIASLPVRHRMALGGALLAAGTTVAFLSWPGPPEAQPAAATTTPSGCHVTATTRITSTTTAVTAVTVTTTGSEPAGARSLSFRLPGEQRLVRGSGLTWSQHGDLVEAGGGTLTSGTSTRASFDTTYRGTVMLPQTFTVGDVVCGTEISVQAPDTAVPAKPTTSPSTTTASRTGAAHARPARKEPRQAPAAPPEPRHAAPPAKHPAPAPPAPKPR